MSMQVLHVRVPRDGRRVHARLERADGARGAQLGYAPVVRHHDGLHHVAEHVHHVPRRAGVPGVHGRVQLRGDCAGLRNVSFGCFSNENNFIASSDSI